MIDWIDLEKNLMEQFRLKTYPIGYKRFEKPDDIDNITDLRKIDHHFAFCQMIAQARRWGLTLGAKSTDKGGLFFHCAMIHGLKPTRPDMFEVPPSDTEMPEGLARFVSSWEDNVKRNKAIQRIPVGGAIAVAPLHAEAFNPDVILIYGDPSQIIMMIQSMQKIELERFEFACIGESSCADSLAECYLTGKPKVGLPGYGERAFGHVADEEMVMAVPPIYLERILDGWASLRKTGVTYPVALAGLDVDIGIPPSIYERPAG